MSRAARQMRKEKDEDWEPMPCMIGKARPFTNPGHGLPRLRMTWPHRMHRQQKSLHLAMQAFYLGWLMGLEPTTTGITILDSTN